MLVLHLKINFVITPFTFFLFVIIIATEENESGVLHVVMWHEMLSEVNSRKMIQVHRDVVNNYGQVSF